MKLTKNFKREEFDCHDGTKVPNELMANVQKVAEQMQVIRDFFGVPIRVNSGYRTPKYNKKIKGSKNSQHMKATACDFKVQGKTAKQVQETLEGLIRIGAIQEGGLGKYRTFTHYDVRNHKSRW